MIDDEKHCLKILKWELDDINEVEVAGVFQSPKDALEQLPITNPDLVFLDIQMPGMTGFDFLKSASRITFDVVFTTAYDEYALQAIKVHASDYLLKPIDPEELQASVKRIYKRRRNGEGVRDISTLLNFLEPVIYPGHNLIPLHTHEAIEFVKPDDIIYCKAEGSYSKIFLIDAQHIFLSKTLKDLENLLRQENFLRVHNSYLINTNRIKKFIKSDGGFLVMINNDVVKISRQKKDELLKRIF